MYQQATGVWVANPDPRGLTATRPLHIVAQQKRPLSYLGRLTPWLILSHFDFFYQSGPPKFNGIIPESQPIYCESLMKIVVTVSL